MNLFHDNNHSFAEPNGLTLQVAEPDPGFFSGDSPQDLEFYKLWQPFSAATSKDVAESKRVAKAIRAVMTQCWFNARKAILKLEDYAQASYCEGWACDKGGSICEHGWVVKDGVIIDPTLPDRDWVYFPGLEFSGRAGIAEFLATPQGRPYKDEPFFYAFGWGGKNSPGYRKAFEQALEWSRACVASREQEERAAEKGHEKNRSPSNSNIQKG